MRYGKKLIEVCSNVFSIEQTENIGLGKRLFKVEDISNMTLIVTHCEFNVQPDNDGKGIYYIEKYDVVLTQKQVIEFVNKHKDEEFLLVDDSEAERGQIWFFITSVPQNLTVHAFHAIGGGHMTLFAILKNVEGECEWQEPEILSPSCLGIYDEDPSRSYRSYSNKPNKKYFKFATDGYRSVVDSGDIINATSKNFPSCLDTHEIMRQFIRINNRTRITRDEDHYRCFFKWDVGAQPNLEKASISARYGLPLQDSKHSYRWKRGGEFMYAIYDTFDAKIPDEDWKRVKARLEAKLLDEEQKYHGDECHIFSASILVITEPVKGHRRPSFHYIKGFRCNHVTEIVQLSCGELLIKDMIPEKIYCLFDDGQYYLVSYDIKTEMRTAITEAEIDPESYNKWAEERSLHPNLLKLLGQNYFDDIELEMVKLFNRLPFGSLLIDQLVTSGHATLATHLAEYITIRAYDFNVFCGQLSDIFPECNGEETSLFKILNISRNTAKYLFKDLDENNVADFIIKYKAIHHYKGNLVLTDEIIGNVEAYLTMYEHNEHKFTLSWGNREFDFLDHPKLAKQIIRMRKKIDALEITVSEKRDIINKYDEIIRAYCSFLDYSTIAPEEERTFWLPEHQKIFVEFSLLGTPERPLDPMEEVSSREKDANKALKVYEDKANEKIKKENEAKFATRRTKLAKLRSTAALAKENPDFKDWVIVPPTQIYGYDVVGSVEKEANDLSHCLFRCYTNRIIEGSYTALWLRTAENPEISVITVGITKEGRIEQTRGWNDRDATPKEARAIAAWAVSKKGMVTFKSEGADVMPGGWPKNVPVPDLPKPNKDWLVKLAGNSQE